MLRHFQQLMLGSCLRKHLFTYSFYFCRRFHATAYCFLIYLWAKVGEGTRGDCEPFPSFISYSSKMISPFQLGLHIALVGGSLLPISFSIFP